MKKRVYLVFEFLMSILLIGFTVLIELKGEIVNHGYFVMALGVPGFIVFLHGAFHKLFRKKYFLLAIILFVISIGCDVSMIFIFNILTLSVKEYIVLAMIDVISCIIILMFSVVYENTK